MDNAPIHCIVDIVIDELIELVDFSCQAGWFEIYSWRVRDTGGEAVQVVQQDPAIIADGYSCLLIYQQWCCAASVESRTAAGVHLPALATRTYWPSKSQDSAPAQQASCTAILKVYEAGCDVAGYRDWQQAASTLEMQQ